MSAQVTPKEITLKPAETVVATNLEVIRYSDFVKAKRLNVYLQINGTIPHQVIVKGEDYDSLGQFTDQSLLEAMAAVLGLEIAVEEPEP